MDRYETGPDVGLPELDARVGWTEALEVQFGSVPWWLVSGVLHALVLALLGLIVVSQPREEVEARELTFDTTPVREIEPPLARQRFVRDDPTPHDMDPVDEVTLLFHDTEEETASDEIVTANNADDNSARGTDGISNVPLKGVAVVANLGIGGGAGGAWGKPWDRGKRKKRARMKIGPPGLSPESEIAVDRALLWLARHQEPDGRWDGAKYEGRNTDVAITGLALLAFLGSGYDEHRESRFRDNVRRGVRWLVAKQEDGGSIGRGYDGGLGYHHAIAGLALAEAYGMAKRQRTGGAAAKAVKYSVEKHQSEYSGWRYKPGEAADMSVTGWFVMQLKAARSAGLKVDGRAFQGATEFLDKCTKPGDDEGPYGGRVSYQPSRAATTTMTSVGLVSRLFVGFKVNDPLVIGAADHLARNLPRWEGEREGVNFYYWYYGTLGMFQVGDEFWKQWNGAMRDMLVGHQRRGGPRIDGSWDPVGRWSAKGGRVYSTAMGALCLEVYYRYPVMLK